MDVNEKIVSSVTLMILGYDLEPSTVSKMLGLKPSRSWRRGEEKQLAKSTFYEWGGWKCFSPKSDEPVEEKIADWLEKLAGKAKAFEEIKANGWRASLDVFVVFDEVLTISISNDLSRQTGELSLELDFSLQSN